MERLSELEEHEVGYVHDVVDRVESDRAEVLLEPLRRRSDLDSADGNSGISRSAGVLFYLYRDGLAFACLEGRDVRIVVFARDAVKLEICVDVPGDAYMRGGVHAVGRDLIFDHRVGLEVEEVLGVSADYRILRKHHDSVMGSTDSELVLGADHSE